MEQGATRSHEHGYGYGHGHGHGQGSHVEVMAYYQDLNGRLSPTSPRSSLVFSTSPSRYLPPPPSSPQPSSSQSKPPGMLTLGFESDDDDDAAGVENPETLVIRPGSKNGSSAQISIQKKKKAFKGKGKGRYHETTEEASACERDSDCGNDHEYENEGAYDRVNSLQDDDDRDYGNDLDDIHNYGHKYAYDNEQEFEIEESDSEEGDTRLVYTKNSQDNESSCYDTYLDGIAHAQSRPLSWHLPSHSQRRLHYYEVMQPERARSLYTVLRQMSPSLYTVKTSEQKSESDQERDDDDGDDDEQGDSETLDPWALQKCHRDGDKDMVSVRGDESHVFEQTTTETLFRTGLLSIATAVPEQQITVTHVEHEPLENVVLVRPQTRTPSSLHEPVDEGSQEDEQEEHEHKQEQEKEQSLSRPTVLINGLTSAELIHSIRFESDREGSPGYYGPAEFKRDEELRRQREAKEQYKQQQKQQQQQQQKQQEQQLLQLQPKRIYGASISGSRVAHVSTSDSRAGVVPVSEEPSLGNGVAKRVSGALTKAAATVWHTATQLATTRFPISHTTVIAPTPVSSSPSSSSSVAIEDNRQS
ncbi:hypothetical protein BGZ94_004003 [Podila epigama]|nr:hypothetical protein BGZ94_004003 [Podila epigama]